MTPNFLDTVNKRTIKSILIKLYPYGFLENKKACYQNKDLPTKKYVIKSLTKSYQ